MDGDSVFRPSARFTLARGGDGGGELVYYRYGPADASQTALAIHGITSSHKAWQWVARLLVGRGVAVFAVDLRGRGDSSGLAGAGFLNHAEDMVAVLDHAGLNKVDLVVGHSMGAFVAAALQSLVPDRIGRSVLIDGGLPLALPGGETIETFLPKLLGPALERLAMKFESKEAYQDWFKVHPGFVGRGWSAALSDYTDYDLRNGSPSTASSAVAADSRDLFESDIVERGLALLPQGTLLIRAARGLCNEPVPLYPEHVLQEALEKFTKVVTQTVDFNHYDIVLSDEGASACVSLIYGP